MAQARNVIITCAVTESIHTPTMTPYPPITTGSRRLALQPEMCSMNFGLYHMLPKYKTWKHAWEPRYLEASRGFIFRDTRNPRESLARDRHSRRASGARRPPTWL